jgi:hypothetical protein
VLSLYSLRKAEYKLLNTIYQQPGVSIERLSKIHGLPYELVVQTMEPMELAGCVQISYYDMDNCCKGLRYTIEPPGLIALADYKEKKRSSSWVLFEDRFWKAAALMISFAALIISGLSLYYSINNIDKKTIIEIKSDNTPITIGSQSQNVSDSRNSLEKNGMQLKK